MINAVKRINVIVKIIGTGRIFHLLMEKVKKEKIKNIELTGYMEKNQLCKEVSKCLFVILPSRCYENSPMSILESFALGKPVVGSMIGGIPELVKDDYTGFTFEPGNIKDLQDKITYLINKPGEVIRMGKNSRELVEKLLDPDNYYSQLINIYKQAREKNENSAS